MTHLQFQIKNRSQVLISFRLKLSIIDICLGIFDPFIDTCKTALKIDVYFITSNWKIRSQISRNAIPRINERIFSVANTNVDKLSNEKRQQYTLPYDANENKTRDNSIILEPTRISRIVLEHLW